MIEDGAGTEGNTVQRGFGNVYLNAGFVLDQSIQPAQQGTAARKHDAAVNDIAGKLRRSAFQRVLDGFHNAHQVFVHCLAHFFGADQDIFRQAIHQVTALDLHCGFAMLGVGGVWRAGGADFQFNLLSSAFAHQQVVFALDKAGNALVQRIARTAYAAGCHNAGKADNSHFRRAAADIHNHAAHRFSGRQPGTNGGGHRLFDHRYLTSTGFGGGLAHGAAFHFGHAGRHADDHARPHEQAAAACLADKTLQHSGGDVKVGNHAVFQRAYRQN